MTWTKESVERAIEEAENDIEPNETMYLFTWTPNPKKYRSTNPRCQWKQLCKGYLVSATCRCFEKYCLLPELNTNGNVHVHGWFILKDYSKWFSFWLPKIKRVGYVKICEATDNFLPLFYYKEDIPKLWEMFKHLPYPMSHCNECDHIKKMRLKRAKDIMVENIERDMELQSYADTIEDLESFIDDYKLKYKKPK